MKKFKFLIYLILIIMIGVLTFFIFKNINKNNNEITNGKTVSETKYFETKIVDLLNSMNNIETRNYSIAISKLPNQSGSTKEKEKSSGDNSGGESSGGNSRRISIWRYFQKSKFCGKFKC